MAILLHHTVHCSITRVVPDDLCTPIAHWVPGAEGLCATCTGSTMPLPQGAAAGGCAGAADQDSSCAGGGSPCLGPMRNRQTCRTAAASCTGLRQGCAPLFLLSASRQATTISSISTEASSASWVILSRVLCLAGSATSRPTT